jgi:Sulfotransferase domain
VSDAAEAGGAGRPAEPVNVLYLGGYSRSGSTLFDRMLGQIATFTSTGELAYVWTHGVLEDRLCGCGAPFSGCGFWQRVGDQAFGGWNAVDGPAMVALYRRVNRHRYLPLLIAPWLSRSYAEDLRAYAAVLARLYGAIQRVSGSRVVVDSSIDPSYCYVLRHVPGVNLRVIHFIRDSRGTAFSWTRRVRRSDVVDREVYLPRYHPGVTALRWSVYHVLLHLVGRLGVPSMRVRYEDVVGRPQEQIRRATEFAGEDIEGMVDLGAFRREAFHLGTDHTVAGNRVRLRRGPVPVRVDDEWRRAMPRRHRRLVTLVSWPLLRLYGYVDGAGARV